MDWNSKNVLRKYEQLKYTFLSVSVYPKLGSNLNLKRTEFVLLLINCYFFQLIWFGLERILSKITLALWGLWNSYKKTDSTSMSGRMSRDHDLWIYSLQGNYHFQNGPFKLGSIFKMRAILINYILCHNMLTSCTPYISISFRRSWLIVIRRMNATPPNETSSNQSFV